MSYLSSYREQQHYEGVSSIPPFNVCVPTSPQPRVLSSYTPSLEIDFTPLAHFLTEIGSSQIAALRSCPRSRSLEPFAIVHPLSIPDF